MISWLKTFLTDLSTSRDGVSFDVLRVGGMLTGLVFLGLAIWHVVVLRQPFDALAYGTGAAALLGGIGAGIGMKAKDEPDSK